MKIFKKLTIVAIAAACAVCLALGIAGCAGGEEHVHTFSEDWTQTETEHWHAATCGHTTQKSGYGKHVDEDDNGKCDTCDYELRHTYSELWLADGENGHYHPATCHDGVKSAVEPHDYDANFKCRVCDYQHNHTPDLTEWKNDENGHWHATTCGHDVKLDYAEHTDVNPKNEVCDVCNHVVPHVHEMSEEWTIDENKHWHISTCHPNDPTVKSDEAAHTFTEGVCACGVKEIEPQVYEIYKQREGDNASEFAEWLSALKDEGVVGMRIAENDDVIYSYDGGDEQIIYVSQRTIKVKAEDQNKQPVAGVYVKVICAINGVTQKFNDGVTDALAIGFTGADGVAEIEFTPIGGFSSATVLYRVKIPEAKDIATVLGIDEESAYPVPNRYLYTDSENIFDVEIEEDSDLSDYVGTVNVTFSGSWRAYHTLYLPYHRYYRDPINGTLLSESADKTFTFTTWGNDYRDYFIFEPYYIPSEFAINKHPGKGDTIMDNAKEAASGVYKISFAVKDGQSANITLYSYNAPDSDAFSEKFETSSISGGTLGELYTGGDFVYVTVEKDYATQLFAFGLKSDTPVEVTLTVEWLSSIEDRVDFEIDWSNATENKVTETWTLKAKNYTKIGLNNFEPGIYKVSFAKSNKASESESFGAFRVYADNQEADIFTLWQAEMANYSTPGERYIGLVRLDEDTKRLYLWNGVSSKTKEITLEKYENLPAFGDKTYVPVTCESAQKYESPIDSSLSGKYTIKLTVCGAESGGKNIPINVFIGGRTYELSVSNTTTKTYFYYSGEIEIKDGDETISLVVTTNNIDYSYFAYAQLTKSE